jgi:flap endonuclease-1
MGVELGDIAAFEKLQWQAMRSKIIAIDGNNTLYQFLSSIRQADGTPLMDSKGRVTGHLAGLFYRTSKWLEEGMKPVFVFDGKPPELKAKTLQERRERKAHAQEQMLTALKEGREEDARMHAQATSKLTQEMIGQAKSLLDAMGIPHVQAVSEGEAEAADLAIRGVAWASASQDYDSLLFGAPRLVRNLSTSGRRKLPRRDEYVQVEPELFELEKIFAATGLNRYQLVWLGMLVGTDFNDGVAGIGPKKGLKLVAGAKSFEEIIEKIPRQHPDESEPSGASSDIPGLENWGQIEEFFLKPPVSGAQEIVFSKPDKQMIVSVLCNEFEFSSERVSRTLDALESRLKESASQKKLFEW